MRRTNRHRRGFTLYELMVALTIGTTVLMAATTLIHNAFRWTQINQHRREDDQTIFQLSKQFRADLHCAVDVQRSDDELILECDEGQVRYQVQTNGVLRIGSDANGDSHRERFRWAIHRDCVFREDSNYRQFSLVVLNAPSTQSIDTIPWRIISASPGLRIRHERGEISP